MCSRARWARARRSSRSMAASSAAGGRQVCDRAVDRARHFGVREERRAEPRENRHGAVELRATDVSELRDARRHQKRLEAEDALAPQRRELRVVPGYDPAPEADVDVAFPVCRLALPGERRNGGRRGHAVQRHVDERGDASGRRRARPGLEAFPLCPAGLVQVHVRIDEARHEDAAAGIDQPRVRRNVLVRRDGRNALAVDVHRGGGEPVGQRDAMTAEDQCGLVTLWLGS